LVYRSLVASPLTLRRLFMRSEIVNSRPIRDLSGSGVGSVRDRRPAGLISLPSGSQLALPHSVGAGHTLSWLKSSLRNLPLRHTAAASWYDSFRRNLATSSPGNRGWTCTGSPEGSGPEMCSFIAAQAAKSDSCAGVSTCVNRSSCFRRARLPFECGVGSRTLAARSGCRQRRSRRAVDPVTRRGQIQDPSALSRWCIRRRRSGCIPRNQGSRPSRRRGRRWPRDACDAS
jgi:hypothetical protein